MPNCSLDREALGLADERNRVCAQSHKVADMQLVYEFAQANPLPKVFTEEYTASPQFSDREKQDIQVYLELVGRE